MLIFCGLDSEAMDALLAALRERKLRIPLKAVVTPYNIQWSSRMLYEELKKEHIIRLQKSQKVTGCFW